MRGIVRSETGYSLDDEADWPAAQVVFALGQARALQQTISGLPLSPDQRLACARAVEHVIAGLTRSIPLRTENR